MIDRGRVWAMAGWFLAVTAGGLNGQFAEEPKHTPDQGTYAVAQRDDISVYELAAAWAPVLWFSNYEQLEEPRLPARMPTDQPPLGPPEVFGTVYYRATVVTPEGGPGILAGWGLSVDDAAATEFEAYPASTATPGVNPGCVLSENVADPTPDCLHLDNIEMIRMQYLLYMENDVGGGGHEHDLEIAEFWFKVRPFGTPGHHYVELEQIVGYAHGHKGFANRLEPGKEDPLTVPLVLLIERGKHAPAPDRTADGMFTPGFDVNQMVADAWGIRDVFGSKWLGHRAYRASMTLGRNDKRQAVFAPSGSPLPAPPRWGYRLRDFKPAATETPASDDLLIYLEHHDYTSAPQNGPNWFFTPLDRVGLGLRVDLGLGLHASGMLFEVPLIGGHVVATGMGGVDFSGTGTWWGYSFLYSPSIAGFYNVYGGVSRLWCSSCTSGFGGGPEAGVKFRIPIPHPPAPDFFGVRIGLRYASFTSLGSPRLLLELGMATP